MNLQGWMTSGWSPLALSLWVASWAGIIALVIGTLIAWLLLRLNLRTKWLLEGFTLLSLVLPPTVLGYYLLILLGQRGIGPWLERAFGIRLVFTWQAAVIAATIAALPLVIQTVRVSLAEISREIEESARLDGCNEWELFWKISIPIARQGILAGGLLGFLRALGDFGATLMVAGNIPGRTQTLSIAIYDSLQAGDYTRANQMALILTFLAFGLLLIVLWLRQRFEAR
jgi:molybdate transport system permease protein